MTVLYYLHSLICQNGHKNATEFHPLTLGLYLMIIMCTCSNGEGQCNQRTSRLPQPTGFCFAITLEQLIVNNNKWLHVCDVEFFWQVITTRFWVSMHRYSEYSEILPIMFLTDVFQTHLIVTTTFFWNIFFFRFLTFY